MRSECFWLEMATTLGTVIFLYPNFSRLYYHGTHKTATYYSAIDIPSLKLCYSIIEF